MCFAVNGTPTVPPCSSTFIDTGATSVIVSVQSVPPAAGGNPMALSLPAGTMFDASNDAGFDLHFTVGSTAAPDAVTFYSGGYAVSGLGLPLFVRSDVVFDIENGRIGFSAHSSQP
jgi:hypothetical protein